MFALQLPKSSQICLISNVYETMFKLVTLQYSFIIQFLRPKDFSIFLFINQFKNNQFCLFNSRIIKIWLQHYKNSLVMETKLVRKIAYSLMQKNGYTFATIYSSKCVSVFLHQTLGITYKDIKINLVVGLDFKE